MLSHPGFNVPFPALGDKNGAKNYFRLFLQLAVTFSGTFDTLSSNLTTLQDAYETLHNCWTVATPQIKIGILVQRLKSCQLKTDKRIKSIIEQDVLLGTSAGVCKSPASATPLGTRNRRHKRPATGEEEGKTLGKDSWMSPPIHSHFTDT